MLLAHRIDKNVSIFSDCADRIAGMFSFAGDSDAVGYLYSITNGNPEGCNALGTPRRKTRLLKPSRTGFNS